MKSVPRIGRAFANLHRAGVPVLAAIALATWLLFLFRRYYFFSDDFLNFIVARDMGLNQQYLARDVFGQFIPLYRLVASLYIQVFGLHFGPWFVLVLVSQLALIAMLALQGERHGASRALLAPVLALAAFSPVLVNAYEWFSAGLSIFPAAVCGVAALLLAQDAPDPPAGRDPWPPARRDAICVLYTAGLLFYPKVLIVIVLIVTIRFYARLQRPGARAAPLAIAAARDALPLLAVAAVYLAVVLHFHYSSGVPRPTATQLAEYVAIAWTHGFAAGAFGFSAQLGQFPWAANLLVLSLLVASIAANRRAAILWGGFIIYFGLSMGLVGLNRRTVFGLESALTARYFCDILYYALAFVMIAHTAHSPAARVRLALPFSLAATLLLSTHLMRVESRVPSQWMYGIPPVLDFVRNVRTSLTHVPASATIADADVPDFIMPRWMSPMTRYRAFLLLFPGAPPVVERGGTLAFDPAGHLGKAPN